MKSGRNLTTSAILFTLAGLFCSAGGLPLLSDSETGEQATRSMAKLLVGVVVLGVAVWQRRRERNAIARGTMAPIDQP